MSQFADEVGERYREREDRGVLQLRSGSGINVHLAHPCNDCHHGQCLKCLINLTFPASLVATHIIGSGVRTIAFRWSFFVYEIPRTVENKDDILATSGEWLGHAPYDKPSSSKAVPGTQYTRERKHYSGNTSLIYHYSVLYHNMIPSFNERSHRILYTFYADNFIAADLITCLYLRQWHTGTEKVKRYRFIA